MKEITDDRQKNYSLLAHNTFGIDVRCRRFVEYGSVEEAQELVRTLTPEDGPLLILGGGSNLLLTGDYEGTVIHSAIRFIEPLGEGHVRCGSGQEWDAFVAWCVANGYHGAENLSLIPGECGASAVQNIGAYGAEACDLIEEVEAVEIATGRPLPPQGQRLWLQLPTEPLQARVARPLPHHLRHLPALHTV